MIKLNKSRDYTPEEIWSYGLRYVSSFGDVIRYDSSKKSYFFIKKEGKLRYIRNLDDLVVNKK